MRILLSVAALLLLGVLLGWLILQESEPASAPPEAGPDAPAAAAVPDFEAGPRTERRSAPAETAAGPRVVKSGSGRFRLPGLVVDEAGAPVPGAWVAAYSSPFPLLDFEQDLAEILEHPLDFELEPLAATFADEEGRFDLSGVPGRTLYLVARTRARLTPRRMRVVSEQLLQEDGVVLRTVAGATLAGRLLGPDGRPVAGAEVLVGPGIKYLIAAFRNRSFFMERVTTDETGRFEVEAVPAGMRLTVYAFATGVLSANGEFGPLAARSLGEVSLRVPPPGSLTGRVLDEEGEGLRGVQVVAAPLDLRQALPFARDIPAWTAVTDAKGVWTFPELPVANYLLLAQGRQGRAAPASGAVAGPGSVGPDITIEAMRLYRGRVVDGEGRPLAGALVQLQSIPVPAGGGPKRRNQVNFLLEAAGEILPEILPAATWIRTDGQGRFAIPAWPQARLRVAAAGLPEADFDLEKVDEDHEPVLMLARPGAIEGVVVDGARGRPVQFYLARGEYQEGPKKPAEDSEGAASMLPEVAEGEILLLPHQSWRANVRASFLCDEEDGRFLLQGLPPGRWRLVVEAEGYASATVKDVAVRSGETTRGVVVGMDPGAAVSGVVVDSVTGEPIAGATVTVGHGRESGFLAMLQGLQRSAAMTQTAEDGSFRVAGAEEGSNYVNVLAADHASAAQEIPPLAAHEEREGVRVEMIPGGSITGLVSDRHGIPLPGRMVGALSIQARDFQQTATDAQGRYRMRNMRPGSYFMLTAALDDDSLFTGDMLSVLTSSRIVTAYVQDGRETVVDIVDEAAGGCRLTGRVLRDGRPLAGAALTAFGTERSGMLDFRMSTARTGEDGTFVFKTMAPGEYALNVEAEGWNGRFTVDVPDFPEHSIVLEVPRTRIRGRIVAATGEPVKDAAVTLVRQDATDSDMTLLFGGGARDRRFASTDEEGRFSLEGLMPGRYRVDVRPGGSRDAHLEEGHPGAASLGRVTVPDFDLGANEHKDLGDLVLPLGGSLKILARGSDGGPVERFFSVRVAREDGAGPAEEEDEGFFSANRGWGREGTAWVRGLEPGRYTVTVEAQDLAPVTLAGVEIRAGEVTERQVLLARGASLKARVLDAQNRPLAGVRLALLDPDGRRVDSGGGFGAFFALFGGEGDGAVPVGTFAPGSYTLRATWQDDVREVPVQLIEGQEQIVEIRF